MFNKDGDIKTEYFDDHSSIERDKYRASQKVVKDVIFQKNDDGNSNDQRDNDLTRNSVVISGLYFTVQGRIDKETRFFKIIHS